MKRIIVFIVILTMLMSVGLRAEETGYKEESIYSVLNEDGSLEQLYVVNALHGESIDYGAYQTIENLTSLDQITVSEGEIGLPAYDGTFYYQGTMTDTRLPWDFQIIYKINGNEVSGTELAGATGALSIEITTRQGDPEKQSFYDSYALQVSLALPDSLCSNIIADGATVVEAGGKKQIAFTILPGSDSDLKVTATVKDFEMDSITINAVNMVFNMDIDTSAFTGQLTELSSAVAALDDGALGLLEGIRQVSEGLVAYTDGMEAYKNGMKKYADEGLMLSSGLSDTAAGLNQLSLQSEALKSGLIGLELGAFSQADQQLSAMGLTLPALNKDNYQTILGAQAELEPLLLQLEQTLQLTGGITAYMDGVTQLATGTEQLSTGLEDYVQGADELAISAQQLYNSAVDINTGLIEIKDGMADYQSGTNAFKESTSDIDGDMSGEIDQMLGEFLGDDSKTVSFVSEQNITTASVQFFLRTEPIAIVKIAEPVAEPEEEYSFWDRVLHLFDWVTELFN